MFKQLTIWLLIIAAGVLFLGTSTLGADELQRVVRGEVLVSVSFGAPIQDEEILDFLAYYKLRPTAVYMSVGDLTGAYHAPEKDLSGEEIIATAREKVEAMQVHAEGTFRSEARRLLSAIQTATDEDDQLALQRRAENILLREHVRQGILEGVPSKTPIIFGVEGRVARRHLQALSDDPLVVSYGIGVYRLTPGGVRVVADQPKLTTSTQMAEVERSLEETVRALLLFVGEDLDRSERPPPAPTPIELQEALQVSTDKKGEI